MAGLETSTGWDVRDLADLSRDHSDLASQRLARRTRPNEIQSDALSITVAIVSQHGGRCGQMCDNEVSIAVVVEISKRDRTS